MGRHIEFNYKSTYKKVCLLIETSNLSIIDALHTLGINGSGSFYRYMSDKDRQHLSTLKAIYHSGKSLESYYLIKNL